MICKVGWKKDFVILTNSHLRLEDSYDAKNTKDRPSLHISLNNALQFYTVPVTVLLPKPVGRGQTLVLI